MSLFLVTGQRRWRAQRNNTGEMIGTPNWRCRTALTRFRKSCARPWPCRAHPPRGAHRHMVCGLLGRVAVPGCGQGHTTARQQRWQNDGDAKMTLCNGTGMILGKGCANPWPCWAHPSHGVHCYLWLPWLWFPVWDRGFAVPGLYVRTIGFPSTDFTVCWWGISGFPGVARRDFHVPLPWSRTV